MGIMFEQPSQFFSIQFCSKDGKSFNNRTLQNDLLKQCLFSYDSTCLTNPGPYFESYIDPTWGQCFRFNSGKNLTGQSTPLLQSTIAGKDDSISLEIYAPTGLVFWIHNSTNIPQRQFRNNHNGDIQYASSGFDTQVAVDRIFDYKLGYPYNDCLNDPTEFKLNMTIINYMISKNVPYSQVNCIELCFDMEYMVNNSCSCTNISLGTVWDNCFGR